MSWRRMLAAATAVVALSVCSSAWAVNSIGLNFVGGRSGGGGGGGGGSDGEMLGAADMAGAQPQANWNNGFGSNSAAALSLTDDSGAATGATATWSGVPNTWTIDGGTAAADANGRLMNGYLDTNNSTGSTNITVDNVPYPVYDVLIYKDGDAGNGRSGDYTVNGVTQTDLQEPGNWPIAGGGGEFLGARTGHPGHVALFRNVSGATLNINADESASGGGFRAPVNGIQILGGNPTSYASAVLSDGPLAYYRFSESSGGTAFDATANGNDGSYIGAPNLGALGPQPSDLTGFNTGNLGTGFNSANSDAVNTPLSLNNLGQFTVEGWVKASTTPQANRTGLFGQNDVIEFGYINDGTIQLWTPATGANNVDAPPDGEWFHLAGVGTGSETQIYINGLLVGVDPGVVASYGSSGDLVNIGGDGVFDGSGNFFLGDLDEVAFYDRALTQAEIMAHVTARGGAVPEPASALLGLIGLAALGLRRRRQVA